MDDVLNYFAERWWGTKNFFFSMFKMGYEIVSYCAKLSSAMVPRIKNDRSVKNLFRQPDKNLGSYMRGSTVQDVSDTYAC